MPAWFQNAKARIALNKIAVGRDCHWSDDLPLAEIVIEAPECALRAGRKFLTSDRIRQIGKAYRHGPIKIICAIRLDGDDEREAKPRRQRPGQAVGWHRRDANLSSARAVIAEQSIGGHADFNASQLGVFLNHRRWECDFCVQRGAHRL